MTGTVIPSRTRDSRTSGKVGKEDILHIADGELPIGQTVGKVRFAADLPARDGGSRGEDEEAWVFLEKVSEVHHEEIAETLSGDQVASFDLVDAH